MKNFSKRILVGVTAKRGVGWREKLEEVKKYKIKKIALFIEEIPIEKRKELYSKLTRSSVKEIPLVHIRDDTTRQEIKFFLKNFKTKYFTIHESNFNILDKWNDFHKNLYLEMNYDNKVPKKVNVGKIGGFCIDLSHFKASEEKWSRDFLYITERKSISRYFKCNHLNGYSYKKNSDMHNVKNTKDFDYIRTLPKFLFGKIIALEMYNPIKEQLRFREYLIKLLNNKFNNK